jgi:hypothetical protein
MPGCKVAAARGSAWVPLGRLARSEQMEELDCCRGVVLWPERLGALVSPTGLVLSRIETD